MRIIFAGSPDFSVATLKALMDSPHEVVGVFSQPDKPKGRGKQLQATPVKVMAQEHNIPVFTPQNFKSDTDKSLVAALNADVMVVVAYGLILPESVLNLPKFGCINVHASILPFYRGASPIQQALLNGDLETGVTIMQMDKGMDTGDVLAIARCEISETETTASLHDKLAMLGAKPLLEVLGTLADVGKISATPQDNAKASYCQKITKEEARIDWSSPSAKIVRQVRAYYPWPIAYFKCDGQMMRVHQAKLKSVSEKNPPGSVLSFDKDSLVVATGDGALAISQLQLPGKKALLMKDIFNGNANKFKKGQILE